MKHKFEIVLPYYKRPEMVKNALESIKNSTYTNWHLSFIDDSGDNSFGTTLYDYGLDPTKISYTPILDSDEQKKEQGYSRHGEFMNYAIEDSDADIIIILCDDDALCHDYMKKLNRFYNDHPYAMWSFCYLNFFDPSIGPYDDPYIVVDSKMIKFNNNLMNQWKAPIHPANKVDSAQVTFKRKVFTEYPIRYPSGVSVNLDSAIMKQIYQYCGVCFPNFLIGQYKGVFSDQMGERIKKGIDIYQTEIK